MLLKKESSKILLNHSLQDNPSNLSYGSTTDMAKQIAGSTECTTIVNQFKSDVTGTNYVRKTNSGTTTLNSTTDLHLAYNNVNYSATGVKSNGVYIAITGETEDFYSNEDIYNASISMYDSEALALYNQYLEQAPASISEGEDFAVAALEGFTQYAVEEGIIEDTVEPFITG